MRDRVKNLRAQKIRIAVTIKVIRNLKIWIWFFNSKKEKSKHSDFWFNAKLSVAIFRRFEIDFWFCISWPKRVFRFGLNFEIHHTFRIQISNFLFRNKNLDFDFFELWFVWRFFIKFRSVQSLQKIRLSSEIRRFPLWIPSRLHLQVSRNIVAISPAISFSNFLSFS